MTATIANLCKWCGLEHAPLTICAEEDLRAFARELDETGLTREELLKERLNPAMRPRLDLKFLGEVLNAVATRKSAFSAPALAMDMGAHIDDVEPALIHLVRRGFINWNGRPAKMPAPKVTEGA